MREITPKQLRYEIKVTEGIVKEMDKKGLEHKFEDKLLRAWRKFLKNMESAKVVNESGTVTVET